MLMMKFVKDKLQRKIPPMVKGHMISCAWPKLRTAVTTLYVGMYHYHESYSHVCH